MLEQRSCTRYACLPPFHAPHALHAHCTASRTLTLQLGQAQKDSTLGLIICCHHLKILNNRIFELVICKRSPAGQ